MVAGLIRATFSRKASFQPEKLYLEVRGELYMGLYGVPLRA